MTVAGNFKNLAKEYLDNLCKEDIPIRKRNNFLLLWKTLEEISLVESPRYTVSEVGVRFEKAGGLKVQSLRNSTGAEYRRLIELFAAERPDARKAASESDPIATALNKVADASVRATLKAALAETAKLRLANSQLQRAMKDYSIDASQLLNPDQASKTDIPQKIQAAVLSPRLLAALKRGMEPSRLQEKGLRVLENGGIEDGRGLLIFPPGFAEAIQSVIDRRAS